MTMIMCKVIMSRVLLFVVALLISSYSITFITFVLYVFSGQFLQDNLEKFPFSGKNFLPDAFGTRGYARKVANHWSNSNL